MHANGTLVHESHSGDDRAGARSIWTRFAREHVRHHDARRVLRLHGRARAGLRPDVPSARTICTAAREEAAIEVRLPESVVREAGRYRLHPALGDAMLQSMSGAVPLEKDGSFSPFTYMPVGIRRVRIVRPIEDYHAAAIHLRAAHVERFESQPGAGRGERAIW